jgi:hypothetical protein
MQPVTWVGRWKFLKGWTKVWSCERHADELPWARRLTHEVALQRVKDGSCWGISSVSGVQEGLWSRA